MSLIPHPPTLLFSHFRPVMVKQRTVSFKCRPMQVHPHAYECTIYEQTKGKFPKEPHVV